MEEIKVIQELFGNFETHLLKSVMSLLPLWIIAVLGHGLIRFELFKDDE